MITPWCERKLDQALNDCLFVVTKPCIFSTFPCQSPERPVYFVWYLVGL